MRFICRVLDMVFAEDVESEKFLILFGCQPKEEGGYTFTSKKEYDNPIEACVNYFGTAEGKMWHKIGDRLEAEGKNRYTGEPVERRP